MFTKYEHIKNVKHLMGEKFASMGRWQITVKAQDMIRGMGKGEILSPGAKGYKNKSRGKGRSL